MEVIINGVKRDLTQSEVEFVKKIFGYWEEVDEVLIFTRDEFLTINEMAEVLGIKPNSVYRYNLRDKARYPLTKKGNFKGCYTQDFLKYWTKGRNGV